MSFVHYILFVYYTYTYVYSRRKKSDSWDLCSENSRFFFFLYETVTENPISHNYRSLYGFDRKCWISNGTTRFSLNIYGSKLVFNTNDSIRTDQLGNCTLYYTGLYSALNISQDARKNVIAARSSLRISGLQQLIC